MFRKENNKTTVRKISLSYIPPLVNLDDLDENLYLNEKSPETESENTRSLKRSNSFRIQDPFVTKGKNSLRRTQSIKLLNDATNFFESKKITGKRFTEVVIGHERYRIYPHAPLGKGQYGKAELAQHVETGEWVVLKKQLKQGDNDNIKWRSIEEINLNEQVGLSPKPKMSPLIRTSDSKQQEQSIIIVKLVEGITAQALLENENELEAFGVSVPVIPYALRVQMAIEILKALKELHSQGILHRDLSPGNVILDLLHQRATMIDLGLSVNADASKAYQTDHIRGSTICYAPEIRQELINRLKDPNYQPQAVTYNEKTESYGAGIMLADFFRLLYPTPEEPVTEWERKSYVMENDIIEGIVEENLMLPASELKSVLEVVNQMTEFDPKKRLLIDDAITEFEKIKQACCNCERKKMALLPAKIMNVEKYLTSNAREALLKQLDTAGDSKDEVWLIDTKPNRSKFEYAELRRALESMHVRVGDQVFVGHWENDLIDAVKTHLNKRPVPSLTSVVEGPSLQPKHHQ